AITLPGHASETDSFLQKRIFFMDKVSLEDQSADFNQVDLIGPRVDAILRTMGFNEIPERDGIKTTSIEGAPVRIISTEKHNYRLLFPSALYNWIDNLLIQNAAIRLTEESFAVLRVESGIPRAGHELTSHYTPLEVNLEKLISDQKGCYTGQEVISRQLTYDKVTRKLVGLHLTSLAKPGDKVFPPDRDHAIGNITSAVSSPRYGFIALAVINHRFSQPGTEVVHQRGEQSWSASVCNLPFR
ncbi:MAG: YgfZ/GcvT domain-containing protein, partial [Anaerolineales bacterium]